MSVIFQITEWDSANEDVTVTNPETGKEYKESKYNLYLFGRTEDDKTVCAKLTDYTPFFYIEVGDTWKKADMEKFIDEIKKVVSYRNGISSYEMIERHRFRGFTNNKLFKYIRLEFANTFAFKAYEKLLSNYVILVD